MTNLGKENCLYFIEVELVTKWKERSQIMFYVELRPVIFFLIVNNFSNGTNTKKII